MPYVQIYHIPWIYTPVRSVLAIWHQLTKTEVSEPLSLNKRNTDRKVSVFVCCVGKKCVNVNTANQTHV